MNHNPTRRFQATFSVELDNDDVAEIQKGIDEQIAKELDNDILFCVGAMACSTMREAFELCHQTNRSLCEFAKYCQKPSTLYDEVTAFIELGGK